jgi:integrase
MAKRKLDDTFVRSVKAKPGERIEIFDTILPAFALRVSGPTPRRPECSKSFVCYYRLAGSSKTPVRRTLGRYPGMSVADARKEARATFEDAERGIARGAPEPVAKVVPAPVVVSVDTAFDRFVKRHLEAKGRATSYIKNTRRMYEHYVKPTWGERDIRTITRADVVEVIDSVVDAGKAVQANRVLAAVRKFLNWATDRSLIEVSPVTKMAAPSAEHSRDRELSPEELRIVWLAADRLGYPYGPVTKLLILTLQRRNEVAQVSWSEFQNLSTPELALWKIPAERTKNGDENDVPLSALAAACLPEKPEEEGGSYVFTNSKGTPVCLFGHTKERLDEACLAVIKERAVEEGRDPEKVQPLTHWTFHDLRRTGSTRMAEDLDIDPHVIEAILNHKTGIIKGVARVYNRAKYLRRKRIALDSWAAYVEHLAQPNSANVVALRSA